MDKVKAFLGKQSKVLFALSAILAALAGYGVGQLDIGGFITAISKALGIG